MHRDSEDSFFGYKTVWYWLLMFFSTPVILYGSAKWTMTKALRRKINAFDMWCQRSTYYPHQLQRSCLQVQTRCSRSLWLYSSFDMVRQRRLRLFGHIVRSDSMLDHPHALRAAIQRPPASWRRPKGRLRLTWTVQVKVGHVLSNATYVQLFRVCTLLDCLASYTTSF